MIETSTSQPQVRLLVLRPQPTGTNEVMRATVLKRWLNYQIKDKTIKTLKSDLADGHVLCALAESLTDGKKVKSTAECPDKREASVLRMKEALNLLEGEGITLPHDTIQQVSTWTSIALFVHSC